MKEKVTKVVQFMALPIIHTLLQLTDRGQPLLLADGLICAIQYRFRTTNTFVQPSTLVLVKPTLVAELL